VAIRNRREVIVTNSAEGHFLRAGFPIEAPGSVCRNRGGIGNGQFSAPIYKVTDPSASRPRRCISCYFSTNISRSILS
jgi:hypothetical protein